MELEQTQDIPEIKYDKFKFNIEDLIKFIFPSSLQHPLAAGRLFAFALCGPLDENLQIRTGAAGKRILAEYELEQMCLQFEKEDIVQIYLHRSRDLGLLTSKEQEAIISQADDKLKKAKGKASLPRLYKKDIYELFNSLVKDEYGRYSFHDAQNLVIKFREDRIKELKLVYPSITVKIDKEVNTSKKDSTTLSDSSIKLPNITTSALQSPNQESTIMNVSDNNDCNNNSSNSTTSPTNNIDNKKMKSKKTRRISRVSEIVAPKTMFLKNQGFTNADIISQTTKYLSKHAFKLTDIDQKATSSITSNIKLLREVPPYCKNPYPKDGPHAREGWNDTATMKEIGLGSMVKSCSSTSTWKRKVTLY